jgi:predicted membrane channel-forming protein YqfA (hemolysin III family)
MAATSVQEPTGGAATISRPQYIDDGKILVKPTLRGVSHQHAFVAALAAGTMLVLSAPSRRAKLVCAVYAATLTVLFGVSATYHRRSWDPKVNLLKCRFRVLRSRQSSNVKRNDVDDV